MTLAGLVWRSASYHWRTNTVVALGVAAAVSVLAGALVVGDSVRGSLRDIAIGRLGRTDSVVSGAGFFREALGEDLRRSLGATSAAPLIIANGFVTHETSRRRASNVLVYGVDERFWRFHGQDAREGVYASPALAAEIGARDGEVLLTRLQRPSEIPVESLFGRKEDIGRTLRLTLTGVLPRDRLGEFALTPQQTAVRAVFVPLGRIQRDLAVPDRVNTVIVAGGLSTVDALRSALQLDDLGVRLGVLDNTPVVTVDTTSGIVSEPLERAVRRAAEKRSVTPVPVFTYLANAMRVGSRSIPYSLITATDLDLLPVPRFDATGRAVPRSRDASAASAVGNQPDTPPSERMVLNEWAARQLGASAGAPVQIEYYVWDPARGLETRTASFTVAGIVPIAGLAADRRLAPDYPGITGSESLADWDPPFPIDLSRIRPQDEQYWREHRTTPKAFISYERGRDLWASRYGAVTSLRFAAPDAAAAAALSQSLERELRQTLVPQAMGVVIQPVRAAALRGATGATDFGEYFTYFSFFLVVSALLLAVLFFRLGIEQRLRQIGILRAAGYTIATLRRLLLAEAVALAAIGAVLGVAGAVGYAQLVIYGLRTWWVGAVGTTLLEVHVSGVSLGIGAIAGVVAATLCVVVSLRTVGRMTPRLLLTAQSVDATPVDPRRARRQARLATLFALTGAALLTVGFLIRTAQAGAFFGAGTALLVASLFYLAGWLQARDARPIEGRGTWAVSRLGFRSAAFRPSRSVLSAALIASAVFIIVSVEAFRRGGGQVLQDAKSGTGGYVLVARSELPLLHDPNEPSGREALSMQAADLAEARFTRFRVREGQDASCLNLYRPTNPTIIAPAPGFLESGRFAFAASLAATDAERANPWLLLYRRFDDGAVPVIADATSLQYVLHARVGDTFSIETGADRPTALRFVAALRDSVLQGELVMAENRFLELFPGQQGYQYFLIDRPGVRTMEQADALAGLVERELQPFGVDAVPAAARLEEFHRVENTYLSTFQALGGLGLLLGTVGLATVMFRNVLERRRELALLRAVGYDTRAISTMILAEAAFLLGAGVLSGVACAAVAIAPAWLGRGGTSPGRGLLLLVVAVIAAGLLSSWLATRAALRGPMLEALRAE